MQIRNDYTSFSNQTYEHAHTHNITECMHEEQVKKHTGEIGKAQSDAVSYRQQRQDTLEMFFLTTKDALPQKHKKSPLSFMKGFWNSLGEEGSSGSIRQIPLFVKEAVVSHAQGMIHSAQTALHSIMQHKFVRSIAKAPATIKTELSAALKRFKSGETFSALTDGKMSSNQNANAQKEKQKGQVTTRKREEIKMKELENSHLMDSYSKKGTYCKINENLTYQKDIAGRQAGKKEVQEKTVK